MNNSDIELQNVGTVGALRVDSSQVEAASDMDNSSQNSDAHATTADHDGPQNSKAPASSQSSMYMKGRDHMGKVKPIDYILVFKDLEDSDQKSLLLQYRDLFMANLQGKGLEVELEGGDTDTKFYKVHAPYELLFKYAEQNKMKMPLKWNDLEQSPGLATRLMNKVTLFNPPTFPEDDDEIEELAVKNPYNYFTAEFENKYRDKFAISELGEENFFTIADRIRITRYLLDNTVFRVASIIGGPNDPESVNESTEEKRLEELMGLNRMIASGAMTAAFPLHAGEYKLDDEIHTNHWIKSLDELNARQKLYYAWASPKAWYKKQPMDPIRRYFGEKIGMYFSWLGYYTTMLLIASGFGLVAFVYGLVTMKSNQTADDLCPGGPNANYIMCPKCDKPCMFWLLQDSCTNVRLTHLFDNDLTVVYSILMALWSTMFLEFWKRKQNELQFEWDLFDFEETEETLRPEFEEAAQKNEANWMKKNPVTQSLEPFMPFSYKIPRLAMSLSTVLFMIFIVVAAIVGVIVYRVIILGILNNAGLQDEASVVTSGTAACLNLVAIMAFSFVYQILATKLTDLECPRTETEYEDSYTLKMFLFQFVNYYSSIIYIAFFKGNFVGYPGHYNTILGSRQEECQPGGCLFELTFQLVIIMVGKQFINNVQEIGVPLAMELYRTKKTEADENKRIKQQMAAGESEAVVKNEIDEPWEKDFLLSPQPKMNLFGEYLEMVIQFGFTTLFATAFPLAPIFAFVNNVIEIRLDAFKFVTALQRPWAQKAQDIGSWYSILEAVGILSVLFNAFTIAITSTYIDKYLYSVSDAHKNDATFWDFIYTTANATSSFAGYDCEDNLLEAYNMTACNPETCYYKAYRMGAGSGDAGSLSEQYWKALAAQFIFVCVFEHLVFFIKTIVAYMVPDMPGDVKVQQLREQHIIKTFLYAADN